MQHVIQGPFSTCPGHSHVLNKLGINHVLSYHCIFFFLLLTFPLKKNKRSKNTQPWAEAAKQTASPFIVCECWVVWQCCDSLYHLTLPFSLITCHSLSFVTYKHIFISCHTSLCWGIQICISEPGDGAL